MQSAPEERSAVDVAVVPDAIAGTHWMSLDLTCLGAVLPVARPAPAHADTSRLLEDGPAREHCSPQPSSEGCEDSDPDVLDLADGSLANRVEKRRAFRTVPESAFVGVGASARRIAPPVKRAGLDDHAGRDEIGPETRPANENAARIVRMIVLAALIASGALWTARQFSRSQAIVVPAPSSDRSMIT